ncbi:hypothetical protein A1O3_07708 [Capronia epimyces CBS 606.96]|uniref:DUF7924 domain-containing protein n=1 Tax=Capronia epimyces CBS 606.96 TaxID=1182542 RepID=W9XWR5_9EURO|nr:uncharacterized protein A1O3_07708 [Capronia epimyces CBS 606.96]EXJ81416.1 hypothetical protein A1O3_07708 [Capronia epimyces CBS 606.96]
MSSFSERHAPKAAAGLDALESPLKPARPDSLHQPQPRRQPALATILRLPTLSQTSNVEDWLTSLDQDRQQHSKSDSHLPRISRFFQSTRILSELESELPKEPTSPDLPSGTSMDSRATSPLVADPMYRERNLVFNNIHIHGIGKTLPEHVQRLVDDMFKERQSPEPEVEDIRNDTALNSLRGDDGSESAVTKYFKRDIFEDPQFSRRLKGLMMTEAVYPMRKEHVPSSYDPDISLPVSQPKPDILYGYLGEAFTSRQQRQFMTMNSTEYTANSQRLIYPFLLVELKGDGPGATAGSLWVATNQCLGGVATCINMAEKLNRYIEQLPVSTVSPVDTTVFSIAMNGIVASLLVSWKEGDGSGEVYNTQEIKWLLFDPEGYLLFRRFVRNVLEWGRGRRRAQIGALLDAVQEESRKKRKLDAMSQDAIKRDSKRSRK